MKQWTKLAIVLVLLCASPLFVHFAGFPATTSAAITFTRGPTVNLLSNDSVTIMWETETATQSQVKYGTSIPLSLQTTLNTTTSTKHRVEITGLTPNTKYYYQAGDGSEWSDIYEFYTAPSGDEPFTFLVYGDHRPHSGTTPPPELGQIIDKMIEEHPRFVISLGDHIQSSAASPEAWNNYVAQTDRIHCNACYWVAMGNHDQPGTKVLASYFEWPGEADRDYYSFDYGNAHFVVMCSEIPGDDYPLGSEGYNIGLEQKDWLEDDLAATNKPHRFVFIHRPLYQTGWVETENLDKRDAVWQIFEENYVEAVFCAHEHHYYHAQIGTIPQIVTGGGGAPLSPVGIFDFFATEIYEETYHYVKVEVNGPTVTYTAYALNGTVIDTFTTTSILNQRPTVTDITHSPRHPGHTDDVIVNATVVDDAAPVSVTCKYRLAGEKTYTSVPMTLISGNLYSANLGTFADQQLFYYYIEVDDTAGSKYQSLLHTFLIDEIPPTVTFTQPTGTPPITVSGTITVVASAQDGIGVAYVEIYLDDVLVENRTGDTAVYTWDTTGVSDGPHTLKAIAYDLAGNSKEVELEVIVSNYPAPPPVSPTIIIIAGAVVAVVVIVIIIVVIRRKRV